MARLPMPHLVVHFRERADERGEGGIRLRRHAFLFRLRKSCCKFRGDVLPGLQVSSLYVYYTMRPSCHWQLTLEEDGCQSLP
jgi:hypothetical protein